jgi:hypothetical protein
LGKVNTEATRRHRRSQFEWQILIRMEDLELTAELIARAERDQEVRRLPDPIVWDLSRLSIGTTQLGWRAWSIFGAGRPGSGRY